MAVIRMWSAVFSVLSQSLKLYLQILELAPERLPSDAKEIAFSLVSLDLICPGMIGHVT